MTKFLSVPISYSGENPSSLTTLQAKRFARESHITQKRKYNDEPYFNHCKRVAIAAGKATHNNFKVMSAAFLHDTIEDCEVNETEMRVLFGDVVIDLVLEVTNVYTTEAYPELNRAKRTKLEHKRLATTSKEAKIIKLCDRIDNLSDIRDADSGFAKKYLAESHHLYHAIKDGDEKLAEQLLEIIERA